MIPQPPSPKADGERESAASPRLSPLRALGVRRERRRWDRRAMSWDREASAGLTEVVAAVLRACAPSTGLLAVDLGCGSGQVTIPLAQTCAHVLAVDVSPLSIERLRDKCTAAAIANITAVAEPIETLDLRPGSLDLVVSNYAMHHLDDAEKARALRRALQWLRPGGRLVVGDMMFGRGAAAEDRRIIADKLWSLLGRGPGGWWRILKNAWRFGLRRGERTLTRGRWEALAREVGFTHIRTQPIVAEAGLLVATRPTGDVPRDAPPVAPPPVPVDRDLTPARPGTSAGA